MAGEKKGKAYEALVHLALMELISAKKLAGPLHWNVTPKGMSIEPDFMTGSDPNIPKTILMLTHSNAVGNSHMKFWRNLGELVEAKTVLPLMPRVYCLTFGVIKPDLEPIQQHAFDQFIWVRQATNAWADNLEAFVARLVGSFPKGKDIQTTFLRDELRNAAREEKSSYQKLKDLLEDMFKVKSKALDLMWEDHRQRTNPSAPGARSTYLRRGTTKLFLVSTLDKLQKDGTFSKGYDPIDGQVLAALGLAAPIAGGHRICDPEIVWALRSIERKHLSSLHQNRQSPLLAEWIDTLRGLSGVNDQVDYLYRHWASLRTTRGLYDHLKLCHADPHKLCPSAVPPKSKRVWLFHALIELIKSGTNTRTGYGIALLIDDLDKLAKDKSHVKSVETILGRKANWLAKHTLGLGLTDWHSNPSKQHFAFSDDDLARVADALARRLQSINKPELTTTPPKLTADIVQTVLEAKLMTYRNYKPFELLLSFELGKFRLSRVASCFADYATSNGVRLDPRSSGTDVVISKSTLINWQSAHGGHTNDKKKELCGRAIGLRYHWNGKTFSRRPGIEKLVLILDGTWKQTDLNALLRAGWDEIYYPDELDQLSKAIV